MVTTPDQLISALQWRYATKRFDASKTIPDETWAILEQALVLTPSSFGLQPWKFLVIRDPEVRAKLSPQSWNQTQVTDASHFVVFTARTDLDGNDIGAWVERMSVAQGSPLENLAPVKAVIEGFVEPMSQSALHAWNVRQVYIALGQFMTSAAVLGIDTCPMEGISAAGYDQVLGLEGTGYATAVACAAGYRAGDDRHASIPKARFDHSQMIEYV